MILLLLVLVPLAGAVLAWLVERLGAAWPRVVSLAALGGCFGLTAAAWLGQASRASLPAVAGPGPWLLEFDAAWLPSIGARFHLAMDGLSLPLVGLTFFLGLAGVIASWTEIRERVGFFHFNLLAVLAGVTVVFLAADLFLFYFGWELMLVPMYFLIAIWGHEGRVHAAIKFFLFTQISGLLMLVALLALYLAHGAQTGLYTFEYRELLGTVLPERTEWWLMLGFFIAFAVKLPVFPLHTWLPDAHTQAPTAGSVILAGLLLKTGGYGLIRFVVPLFPGAAADFAPVAMTLAVAGILYGAILALGQTDLKRLVAYTSVSHLGFVLLGVFAWNTLALQGALLQMVAHGISTGALFVVAGLLQERMHTRDIDRMGGLWSVAPRLGGVALFFALASLGLPGLGDFAAEFLVLLGAFQASAVAASVAALGMVASALYSLRLVQRAFQGTNTNGWRIPDLVPREALLFAPMVAVLVWLGLYPQPVIDTFRPVAERLQQATTLPVNAEGRPEAVLGAEVGQ
ncbi:MAG TPA: NADH-quinone oxidoreductase subunit M [Vicinamibacterales bacterium]|nr:NADH-quinone oxidoreductase subunit M [Vicinamibacterales bacterium]